MTPRTGPSIDELSDLPDVRLEHLDDGILGVTLDRPDRLNAITQDLIAQMRSVVNAVDLDGDLRAVILTGAGRGFCAGLDLQGDRSRPPGAEGRERTAAGFMTQATIASLNEEINRSRKPWIAAVNGPCVGGGLGIALSCDIRLASRSATFGAVYTKIGLSNADMGTTYWLPRLVGASRAAELLLTARIIDADEAERIGLVVGLFDDAPVDAPIAERPVVQRALETAQLIRSNPPFGTWMTKEVMWQTIDAPSLRAAMDIENRTQVMLSSAGAVDEAMAAFGEKRTPEWGPL